MSKLTLVFPIAAIAFLLLLFAEIVPLLPRDVCLTPKDSTRWRRKDSAAVLAITLLYAIVAFAGLGDRVGVESFCKFASRGQYANIELDEPVPIGSVRAYGGLFMGKYYVQLSADGENYTDIGTIGQAHADVFKWRDTALQNDFGPAKFVRLIADSQLWLGELAIYDADGARIPASRMHYSAGVAPLFDEQALVPETITYKNGTYFDEIYHARTAYEHIKNEIPYEITHPPLGKLILSIGIRLFGMVPFGWRFSGTVIGILMLPAIYLFLKKMFGGTAVPACCTAVYAADFMHFVQTRIATIDSYSVFFIILMYLFFWLYWRAPRERARDWLPPLALSGLCFGLGAASKWTCLYAGAGLGVLWLIDRVRRAIVLRGAEERGAYLRETAGNILACLAFFVAVPAVVYYVSYWPYGTARGMHGPGMLFSWNYLRVVLENQRYMLTYHAGVTSSHPYSSVWWQWLLDVRPILYYLEYLPDGRHVSFGAWLNPMLCWGGLLAMVCMVYRALFRRDRTALFILVGYLAQLVPWLFVTRVVFEYHYFPSSVFLLLAIGHLFRTAELSRPRWRHTLFSFTGVTVLLFAVFYPALAGVAIPSWYGTGFLKWMGSWPF